MRRRSDEKVQCREGAPRKGKMADAVKARGLRILHTSDWHIGRIFHGHPTYDALREVLRALVEIVRQRQVDVVAIAGDVFDSSTPAAEAVEMLDEVLLEMTKAGVVVVTISGNHDSPARLGAKSVFAQAAGVHVITRPEQIAEPVVLADAYGPVNFYGIPFLEPSRLRSLWPHVEPMRSQRDALNHAMSLVRADLADRGGRTVVLAHTFVQGAEAESAESERDIVGGLDVVPTTLFTDMSYTALGHIHSPAKLARNLGYCGSPLHGSFSEAGKPRGAWLVELDAAGANQVEWVELPVPRPLTTVTGSLAQILANPEHRTAEQHWVKAVITDSTRPMDAMKRLQVRFPYCVHLDFQPLGGMVETDSGYAELVRGRSDADLVELFLAKVRNGNGADAAESDLIREAIAQCAAQEVAG
jgi:DNA repair protein SbcD/Mre11